MWRRATKNQARRDGLGELLVCRRRFRRGATQVLISETVCKTGNPMFKRFTTVTHSNVWTRPRRSSEREEIYRCECHWSHASRGLVPRCPVVPSLSLSGARGWTKKSLWLTVATPRRRP